MEQPARARVLIVDDQERVATTLRMALSDRYDVVVKGSAATALPLIETGAFDLILCDVLLPDLSGPDLLEAACATVADVRSRFIFLTGGALNTQLDKRLEASGAPRLEKPFALERLEELMAERLLFERPSASIRRAKNDAPDKPGTEGAA